MTSEARTARGNRRSAGVADETTAPGRSGIASARRSGSTGRRLLRASSLGPINENDPRPCTASGRGWMRQDMTSRRVSEKSRRPPGRAAGSTRHTPPRESGGGRPRAGRPAKRRRAPREDETLRREAKPFRGPVQRVSHARVQVFAHDHRLEITSLRPLASSARPGPARSPPPDECVTSEGVSAATVDRDSAGAARSRSRAGRCPTLPRPGSTRKPSRCKGPRRSPSVRTSGPTGSSPALREPGPWGIRSRTNAPSLPSPHESQVSRRRLPRLGHLAPRRQDRISPSLRARASHPASLAFAHVCAAAAHVRTSFSSGSVRPRLATATHQEES